MTSSQADGLQPLFPVDSIEFPASLGIFEAGACSLHAMQADLVQVSYVMGMPHRHVYTKM